MKCLVPCKDCDAVKKHLDSEGRLVDGHEDDATSLGNVLHLLHHTESTCRVKTWGWFIEEKKGGFVDYVDPYRHPSTLSPWHPSPPFIANICVCCTLESNIINKLVYYKTGRQREREREIYTCKPSWSRSSKTLFLFSGLEMEGESLTSAANMKVSKTVNMGKSWSSCIT